MKKALKRLLALVLVLSMSTVVFGYTVDEIMGDKYPLKDYLDGVNYFSVNPKNCYKNAQFFDVAEDWITKNGDNRFLIEFGNYPQDGISDMAKEPIKWVILEKVNGMALLMSLKVLDAKQMYNMTKQQYEATDVSDKTVWTYENSDLRKWLNNEFYNKAFSSSEKKYIVQYDLTSDKVLLPTVSEIQTYFRFNKQDFRWQPIYKGLSVDYLSYGNPWGTTVSTNYANNQSSQLSQNYTGILRSYSVNSYWTRTPAGVEQSKKGKNRVCYKTFRIDSTKNEFKSDSFINPNGVRPCIWISFDPYVRSAKELEWEKNGGKIASGLASGFLDSLLPGIGLFLP